MDLPSLGEDAIVAVFDLGGEVIKGIIAEFMQLWITERHESRLEVLGRNAVVAGVIDEATCEVAFLHGTSRPVDDLRREHAANAQLFAKAEQEHVDWG